MIWKNWWKKNGNEVTTRNLRVRLDCFGNPELIGEIIPTIELEADVLQQMASITTLKGSGLGIGELVAEFSVLDRRESGKGWCVVMGIFKRKAKK